MALATRVMNYRRHWIDPDLETHCAQAGANVDVLIIQKITLVEATHSPERFRLEQHEHTRNPIRLERLGRHWIVESGGNAKRLAEKSRQGRKAPRIVLNAPFRVNDAGGYYADVRVSQSGQQPRERVLPKPHVGIQHAEVCAFGGAKCCVMIGRESLGSGILAYRKFERFSRCPRRNRFAHVLRKDNFQWHRVTSGQISQQLLNQLTVAMAHERYRDYDGRRI